MTSNMQFFDGGSMKAVGLDQFPEQAWTNLSPSAVLGVNDSREDVQAIQGYYETVAWLFRCVTLRQFGISRIPWAIIDKSSGEDVWLSSEPDPPKQLDYFKNIRRLLRLTEAAMLMAPETFWFREKNRVRTLSLRWFAPSSVIPQWDAVEGLTGFKRIIGGGQPPQFYDPDDIVYFPIENPMHETIPGRPPAQAAMSAAGVVYNVDAFASGFFERGAIKATLLTVEPGASDPELRKLERWWKRFYAGIQKAWQTAAVRAGVTPVVVGQGIDELGNTTLTVEKKEEIATALGIPHSLVFSNAANFATAEVDERSFYDKTMIPSFDSHAEYINRQLLEAQGLMLVNRHKEMTVFQADENKRSQSFKMYVEAGMKQSVAAEILGIDLPNDMEYEELDENDDVEETEEDTTPVSASSVIGQATPAEQDEAKSVGGDVVEEAEKIAETAQLRRWLKNRKNPDLNKFESKHLGYYDKIAIMVDAASDETLDKQPVAVAEDADSAMPPFPLAALKPSVKSEPMP